jgi:hypothetical protein
MKRFAVLFAAGVFLIPAAGCQDSGGGGETTTPSSATTTTTPAPSPTGKAPPKDAERRAKAGAATANPNGPKNDH